MGRSGMDGNVRLFIPGYGMAMCSVDALDRAMQKYLPASPSALRDVAEMRTQLTFADVKTVSAFLIILADFDELRSKLDHVDAE